MLGDIPRGVTKLIRDSLHAQKTHRPSLLATSPDAIANKMLSFGLYALAFVIAQFFALRFGLPLALTAIKNGALGYQPTGDRETALMAVSLVALCMVWILTFSSFLDTDHLHMRQIYRTWLTFHTRYHRGHIAHMRLDRLRRLVSCAPKTAYVSVDGFRHRIWPIVVFPSVSASEVKQEFFARGYSAVFSSIQLRSSPPSDFSKFAASFSIFSSLCQLLLAMVTLASLYRPSCSVSTRPLGVIPSRIYGGGRRGESGSMDICDFFGSRGVGPLLSQSALDPQVSPSILKSSSVQFPQLTIPMEHRAVLLPSIESSVSSMLSFQLPVVARRIPEDLDIEAFITTSTPTSPFDPSSLKFIPVPPRKTVMALLSYVAQLEDITGQFVALQPSHCTMSSVLLPPWVLGYWFDVLELREQHFDKWRRAIKYASETQERMVKQTGDSRMDPTKVLVNLLDELDWSGHTRGFAMPSFVSELLPYLSNEWLSNLHVDQMLELIQRKVGARQPSQSETSTSGKPAIQSVTFSTTIKNIYVDKQLQSQYENNGGASWLRSIGDDLASGRITTLLGVANINQSHWISYGIDAVSREIKIGDSLGGPIPQAFLNSLRWWLSQHLDGTFSVTRMKIGKQADSNSCALFAVNAVGCHVLPGYFTELTQDNVAFTRIEFMQDVVFEHLEHTNVFGPSVSYRYRFCSDTPTVTVRVAKAEVDSPPPSPITGMQHSKEFSPPAPPCKHGRPTPDPSPQKKRYRQMPISTAKTDSSLFGSDLDSGSDSESCVDEDAQSDGARRTLFTSVSPDSPLDSDDDNTDSDSINIRTPIVLIRMSKQSRAKPSKELIAADLSEEGILRYFKKATAEEIAEQDARIREASLLERDETERFETRMKEKQLFKLRVDARHRQQKCRDRKKRSEIREGLRSPGGTKFRRRVMVLFDDSDMSDAAEQSRPYRQFKEKQRANQKQTGRKRLEKNMPKNARYVNWCLPWLWRQIDQAARRVGSPWSPRAIINYLLKQDRTIFSRLREQTIGKWIDKDARARGEFKWTDKILLRVADGFAPGGENTRRNILSYFPDLRNHIVSHLTQMRNQGAAITVASARAVIAALIEKHAPSLLQREITKGVRFKCSDAFVKKFLRDDLGWSERKGTRAAQKQPDNWRAEIRKAWLRLARLIRDDRIPAELIVNSDQSQIVLQQGTSRTWTERGARQVAILGREEKRAFTCMPSISLSGRLVNLQSIWQGKTDKSLPSPSARCYEEAIALGCTFESSKTKTYWSTHRTMHTFVQETLAPHFRRSIEALGLPDDQRCIWMIDCWSLHKSQEFRDWMKTNFPWITILYVPGGCTGIFQPLDVGFQRVFKHAIKRAAHADLVDEALQHLSESKDGESLGSLRFDVTLSTLRDRSVGWLVSAHRKVNDVALIKKCFEMCRLDDDPECNLSYESLTSSKALSALRDLPRSDPDFFKELYQLDNSILEDELGEILEDEPSDGDDQDDGYLDGTDVPVRVLMDVVMNHGLSGKHAEDYEVDDEGSVQSVSTIDQLGLDLDEPQDDSIIDQFVEAVNAANESEELGRGRRKKAKPKRFFDKEWENY